MVKNPDTPLEPSRIAKYIKLNKCSRYFKITVDKDYNEEQAFDRPRNAFQEAVTRRQIIQKRAGEEFEEEVLHDLSDIVDSTISLDELAEHSGKTNSGEPLYAPTVTKDVLNAITANVTKENPVNESYLVHQPAFRGDIENWRMRGDADLLFTFRDEETTVFHIIDVKMVQEEQAHHQIQTAIYSLLLKGVLDNLGVDESTYEIRTGVLVPDDEWEELSLQTLPQFTRQTREGDIIRMLKADGEFSALEKQDFNDVPYRIDSKCQNCPHNEICLTQSIENANLELLGVKQSIQSKLKEEGIETLYDIAALGEPPFDEDEYIDPTETGADIGLERTTNVFDRLSRNPNFNADLTELVLRARTLLGKIDADDFHARSGYGYEWLLRSGRSDLPEDNPHENSFTDFPFKHGSMIRVYLNAQHDAARDRLVSLGATVDATVSDAGPISISETSTQLPDNESGAAWEEMRLLKTFIGKLSNAMEEIRNGIDLTGTPYDGVPLHFYVFSNDEKSILIERLEEHAAPPNTIDVESTADNTIQEATVLLNMLGHRSGLDEHMLSVIKSDEIDARQAHRTPSLGLIQIADYYQPDSLNRKSRTDWSYTPDDTSRLPSSINEVDLTRVFNWRLFNDRQPYQKEQNEPLSFLLDKSSDDIDGFYPNRFRSGAKIPLEYIWAAAGRIDEDWVESIKDEIDETWMIERFRYHGYNADNKVPITVEDINALVEEFTDALMRIDRGVWHKNYDHSKTPMTLEEFKQATDTGADTLAEACMEYLGLEYTADHAETTQQYHERPRNRLANGESLIFTVEDFEERNGKLLVHGSLAYDLLENISSPEEYRDVIRTKDATAGGSSGAYLTATPVDSTDVWEPNNIERGTLSRVVNLDQAADNSAYELTIEMHGQSYYNDDEDGVLSLDTPHRRGWDTDARDDDSSAYAVYEGRVFFLDPRPSDITASFTEDALKHPTNNDTYSLIEELRSGETTCPCSLRFSEQDIEDFVDWQTNWTEENPDNDYGLFPPNTAQREFITEATRELSVLHGAPGTGKTTGGIGPGVAARVYAAGVNNDQCCGLITGASNKAINEAMEDIAAVIEAYKEHGEKDVFDNLRLIRVTGAEKPTNPEIDVDTVPGVEYATYNGDDPDEDVWYDLKSRLLFEDADEDDDPSSIKHTLVFATPIRAWRIFDMGGKPTSTKLHEQGVSAFDLLVADEASMLSPAKLFLAGAFYDRGGQVLLAGDHRQMPPVNQYDWSNEFRPSVMTFAPYLSSLNYVRLLKGEELKVISDDLRDRIQVAIDHMERDELPIPVTQFPKSYRSHKVLPEFLQRHVYEADDLEYYSEKTETMATPSPSTQAIATALNEEKPITLVTYDGTAAQQSNQVEERITHYLIDGLHPNETSGVVTPHNAQRSLIEQSMRDLTNPHSDVDIDTVERFQGGERDVMLMNGTVSDPDYIDAESEFLLNLNRVNVAVSRMKKKLIVIASKSIFRHTPLDTDEYEHTKLWKGLATELGVLDSDTNPSWEGTLSEFTAEQPGSLPRNPRLEVYTLGPDDEMSSIDADITSLHSLDG